MAKKNIFTDRFFLAPMAGYTDMAFRGVCSIMGADITMTEMVSSKGILKSNKKTLELLRRAKVEKIVGIQLFGNDADEMAQACLDKEVQKFDFIDINMGCPVPKITKNKSGASLMQNVQTAHEIVRKCVDNSNIPVTVKFRLGWDSENINAVEFAMMCEKAGASAITIHGRTRSQGYTGEADLSIIKEIKENVSIPIIANGDIDSIDRVKLAFSLGAQSIMIGRSSLGYPHIFNKLKRCEFSKNKAKKLRRRAFKIHYSLLKQHYSDKYITLSLKKHGVKYLKEIENSNSYKTTILRLENHKLIYKIIRKALRK